MSPNRGFQPQAPIGTYMAIQGAAAPSTPAMEYPEDNQGAAAPCTPALEGFNNKTMF